MQETIGMIQFHDLKKINEAFEPSLSMTIKQVIDSGWYLRGNKVNQFESDFSSYIGTDNTIGCANGLDALTLILKGYVELGVMKHGDEIIVPANTYIASILAISEAGLSPIVVDADPITLQINPDLIEQAITSRTRGIMIVHLYGKCAYTPQIGEICNKYSLKLIEDNAQAVGCRYDNILTGALGDAAGHSFYPGKNLGAIGDAGAVTTNDSELAKIIRTLAFYGSEKKYVFDYIGRNSRIDEVQAAVLNVKLPKLDRDNQYRRRIAEIYRQNIKNPYVRLPYNSEFTYNSSDNIFHIFPIFSEYRDELQHYLTKNRVQTLIHYPIPPHQQKCYNGILNPRFPLPITEMIHSQELSLPISQVMSQEEAFKVAELINSFKPHISY